MSLLKVVKTGYRLLPYDLRVLLRQNRAFGRLMKKMKDVLEIKASHDDIYDATFFESIDGASVQSATTIADALMTTFAPVSVIDVGCGGGALLHELQSRGLRVRGLEYADAAIERCRKRGIAVEKFDLEQETGVADRYDVAVSLEVAEHLPPDCADSYVGLLTGASDRIVMTAATPGQGGSDHVNEQPNEYWIEKFTRKGFAYRKDLSERWRSEWREKGAHAYYTSNVMVFERPL